jgi:hypothetical protein
MEGEPSSSTGSPGHAQEHDEHRKHGHHRHEHHVEVLVKDKPTTVEYVPQEHGRTLVEKALAKTHHSDQKPENWELRNEKGEKLEQNLHISEYHLKSNDKLTLGPVHERHDESRVEVIVNGKPTVVEYVPHEQGRVLVEKALKQTQNSARPPEDWELRNEKGAKLEQGLRISEYHLKPHDKLFLNLKAGGGGSAYNVR